MPQAALSIQPPGFGPPPRIDELVTDDGIPMASNRHVPQMILLRETLELAWAARGDFSCSTNMFLYDSTPQTRKNDFHGPDIFVAGTMSLTGDEACAEQARLRAEDAHVEARARSDERARRLAAHEERFGKLT